VIVKTHIDLQSALWYTGSRIRKGANEMGVTLKDIIGLAKELPEEYFEETFERLKEIKEKAEA
jgi:hypothetical protein